MFKAAIDPEFRRDLSDHPETMLDSEELSLLRAMGAALPEAVQVGDLEIADQLDSVDLFGANSTHCRCTCISGFTIKCDGRSL